MDEEKIKDFNQQIDENKEIENTNSIDKSDLVIFFLTNKFIESDQFKEDWRISQKKVFLIVLLENTPPLSFIFDLNQLYVFNNFDSDKIKDSINMFKIFLSRLINFKYLNTASTSVIDSSQIKSKIFEFLINNFENEHDIKTFVKKMEFIEKDVVIMKTSLKKYYYKGKICIIDWRKAKIVSEISNEGVYHLDFSWINHINQILVYQTKRDRQTGEESKFLLFTKEGQPVQPVRSVFSLDTDLYKVKSISYNKNTFEVYLNVFDNINNKGSIWVLNEKFENIKILDTSLTCEGWPLDFSSEIEIFNIRYNIFHYNSNIALLQEKNSITDDEYYFVYVFDKISYSIVGVLKTNNQLIGLYQGNMMFLLKSRSNHLIQKMPLPIYNSPDSFAFCKLNSFKPPHLLSKPYSLSCGYLACLECIHNHYNIFKRKFKCPFCNQEHKLQRHELTMNNLLNQNVFSIVIEKFKNLINGFGMIFI